MKKLFITSLFLVSVYFLKAGGVTPSPNSACQGETLTITITGMIRTSATSNCGAISMSTAGLTTGSGGANIVLQPNNVTIINNTSFSMEITIPSNFAPGQYGITGNAGFCANYFGFCDNCFTVNETPVINGGISGPASACVGDTLTYSVGNVSVASSYSWTFPSNWDTGLSTPQSQTLVVAGNQLGDVTVKAFSSACGFSNTVSLSITAIDSLPPKPTILVNGTQLTSSSSNATQIWYLDGTQIGVGTSITATASGDYTVEVTGICGTTASDPVTVTITGIENNLSLQGEIYPNPVVGTLQIKNANKVGSHFELFNLEGKLVYELNSSQELISIDMLNLPKGIYSLKVSGASMSHVHKIVKQ